MHKNRAIDLPKSLLYGNSVIGVLTSMQRAIPIKMMSVLGHFYMVYGWDFFFKGKGVTSLSNLIRLDVSRRGCKRGKTCTFKNRIEHSC